MVWFVLFVTLTSNSPLNHKFISKKERDHIIANTDSKKGSLLIQSKQRKQATPWRQIFLSRFDYSYVYYMKLVTKIL